MRKWYEYIDQYGEVVLRKTLAFLQWSFAHHVWLYAGIALIVGGVIGLLVTAIVTLVRRDRALQAQIAGLRVQMGEFQAHLCQGIEGRIKPLENADKNFAALLVDNGQRLSKMEEDLLETRNLTDVGIKANWKSLETHKVLLDGMMEIWTVLNGKADRRSGAKVSRKKRR